MIYQITEKRVTNEDNITYLGYGIQAHDGLLTLEIEDVSSDRSEVEAYISALRERQVPFWDITDTVSDMIAGAYAVTV